MAVGGTEWIEDVQLDGIAITDHDFKVLLQDINDKERSCKKMKDYIDNQESKIEILKENLKRLERENEQLQPAIEDIERKTCTSQDARKMFGDVVPGDTTHKDVTISFKDYFNKAFRNLPKSLEESEEGKHKIWEMTCRIVQECFELNKIEIINEMIKELETALVNPPLPNESLLDDKTADLYKAFHVFLIKVMDKKGSSSDIGKRIKDDLKQELQSQEWDRKRLTSDIELATDILTNVDPEDYVSIIGEGKKREKHYYPGIQRKDVVCFACKKKFETDKNDDFSIQHSGKHWHIHHYSCRRCNKVIGCENFTYFKDHDFIYCNNCFCSRCQHALYKEEYQDENGLLYHPACVRCQHCGTTGNIKLKLICVNCRHVVSNS